MTTDPKFDRICDHLAALTRAQERTAATLERIEALFAAAEDAQPRTDLTPEELRAIKEFSLTPEEEQIADAIEPFLARIRIEAGDGPIYTVDRATTPPSITFPRDIFEEIDPRHWPQILDAYGAFCKGGEVLCYNTPQNDRKIAPKWQN